MRTRDRPVDVRVNYLNVRDELRGRNIAHHGEHRLS